MTEKRRKAPVLNPTRDAGARPGKEAPMRLLLFLLFPALELYLLVKVGAEIGALNMVIWVFVSAVIGIWAVRAQGQDSMNKARTDLAAGRVPQNSFLDGLLIFFGGVMLILPGLVTDAVGLFLLVPPLRHWAAGTLAGYLTAQQSRPGGASRVIFFRSGGGPFPGGPMPYQGERGEAGVRTGQGFDDDPAGPRQATIIESTAIDITVEGPAREGDNDTPAGTKG